ncbi:MAG: hypothetical protein PUC06_08630, partial [Oscillospiraceae bacterium]|nr:hypothetical protein [Oscillospiraceae bacterium]
EENFRYILNATCTGISETVVQYRDAEGQEHLLPADSVVISAGMRAQTEEALRYAAAGQYFCLVGDCEKAQSVQQAVRSAYSAAMIL